MPKVGKQKFPYTSGGVQKAQKHAKATGQKVDMSGYKKGGKVKKAYNGSFIARDPGSNASYRKYYKGMI